jgi:hypothetical protein
LRRRRPFAPIATPPAIPARVAPPAISGTFALLAASPTAWPAPCAVLATAFRASSIRPLPFALDVLRRFAEVVRRPFELRLDLAGLLREAALLRVDACERARGDLLAVEARLRGFVFAAVAISSSLNAFGIRS